MLMVTAMTRIRRAPAAAGRPGSDGAILLARCGEDGPDIGGAPIGESPAPELSVLQVLPRVREVDESPTGNGLEGRTTRLDDRSKGGPAIAARVAELRGARARRILGARLKYIPHPSFDDPAARDAILGPLPVPADGKAPRRTKPPKGLPPYLADLYENPLLSREQEMHLFRKMNYLKFLANRLRERIEPTRARTADLDEIERLQEEALAVKNQVIRANLRLVVSIAKRHVGPSNNFFELVSDGNMSLIRAVEKFDFARGNKFSTYASWAIMKNFARTIPEENYRRDRFVTGHEEMFEAAADNRTDEHEYESALKRMQEAVKGMLGRLDERERKIIVSRFGLGGASEQTLEQLGRELGITKERVRQIESRAQDKLRKIASEEKLDLPML
jgi:RNA polymerase primary sigma factor